MKKVFLLLSVIATLAVASCSSDSDSGTTKRASKITTTNDASDVTVYNITYDSNKRIGQILRHTDADDLVYTFAYNSNNLITSIVTSGDDVGIMTFSYDSNKRLVGIGVDGDPDIPVSYSGGTYTVNSI